MGILAAHAPITLNLHVKFVFLADFQFAVSRSLQLCPTTKIVALFSKGYSFIFFLYFLHFMVALVWVLDLGSFIEFFLGEGFHLMRFGACGVRLSWGSGV